MLPVPEHYDAILQSVKPELERWAEVELVATNAYGIRAYRVRCCNLTATQRQTQSVFVVFVSMMHM